MPLRLADLAKRTKTTTVDLYGDVVTLEVRYQLITPRLMADLLALDTDRMQNDPQAASGALLGLSEQVARLVASWDVLDADGSMFPLDVARLQAEIPADIQMRVLNAAAGVMTTGEALAPQS